VLAAAALVGLVTLLLALVLGLLVFTTSEVSLARWRPNAEWGRGRGGAAGTPPGPSGLLD
jgi:hypothetical protein